MAIPAKYDAVLPFSERLAAVQIGGLAGYIDSDGAMVIPARFLRAMPFAEGRAVVELPGKGTWIRGDLLHRPHRAGRDSRAIP